jgi:hypothetical protein
MPGIPRESSADDLPLIVDSARLDTDKLYREEMRFRFETDHFFAAAVMGFNQFNRALHQPAVDLFFPKNRKLSIEDQDPIKMRMHLDPRKTFKTTLGLVDTAQFIAAHSERLTLLYETATQPLARGMMNITVQHFGRGLLCRLYPEIVFKQRGKEDCFDSMTRLDLSIDPTVGYTSPASAQAGWHPLLLNCDDMVDALNSGIKATEETRKELIAVHHTNKNTLRAGGYLNIRGTRYHPFDLYGHELERMNPKKWKVLIRCSVIVKSGERLMEGEFPAEDDVICPFSALPDMDYESLRDLFYAEYTSFMNQQQNDPAGGSTQKFTDKMWQAAQLPLERIPVTGDGVYLCWRLPYGGKPYMVDAAEGAAVRIARGKVYVLDAWRGSYAPTGLAEKITRTVKQYEPDALILEDLPGSQYMESLIRQELMRRNLSTRIEWAAFEEDDHTRIQAMLQLEALMKAGRLYFSQSMSNIKDTYRQFVHFGLVKENGIVDAIRRCAENTQISLIRAQMTESELEWQQKIRENQQWAQIFEAQGVPLVDEQARMIAQASMMAQESASSFNGLPPLPGGLDG